MTDDISVSFKVGTGFDAPLFNFKGSTGEEVKARLVEFFGLSVDASQEATPFDVFFEAGHVALSQYSAVKGLGAKPVQYNDVNSVPAERTPTANGAGFTAPVVESPHALLIASIDSAADEASLFALARENKTVWSGDVRAAADKRLAELRAAA